MDIWVDISTQLFPNPLTMLYTLCVTAILFYFVYRLVFNPAREIIRKRADYVQGKLTEADALNTEAQTNLMLAKDEIDKAQTLSKDIIANAKKEAVDVKNSIVNDANVKADDIYRKAHERIKKEEIELRRDINKQIVDVALCASEKLIAKKDLSDEDQESIARLVEELNEKSDN